MSGPLTHSPIDVLHQLLIDLGLGTDPLASGTWPVYKTVEPSTPDNVITVVGTSGVIVGDTMVDGEYQVQYGAQIRVRGQDHDVGHGKVNTIATKLDTDVYQRAVTVSANSYTVHSVDRESGPLELGKDTPNTKRELFTHNVLVTMRQSS